MPNKTASYVVIGLCSFVLPTFVMAEDLSKDEWLAGFGKAAPEMVCQNLTGNVGVNPLLMQANITFDKCITIIPTLFDKCKTQSYYLMPDSINTEAAAKWGNIIGQCIGTDFAVTYLTTVLKPHTVFPTPEPSGTTATDISKTDWLNRLKAAAPEQICSGLVHDPLRSNDLSKLNITYEKCLTLIPPLFKQCEEELATSLPPTFNKYQGENWTQIVGQCIGNGFAKKYLLPTPVSQ